MYKTVSGGTITIPVIHAYGDMTLELSDLKYSVTDVDGTVLFGPATPVGFDGTSGSTDIVIEGQYNITIKKYDVRSLSAELTSIDGSKYNHTEFYEVEGDILKLTPFIDSFMSFPESILVRRLLSAPAQYYDGLSDEQKSVALENAFERISNLKFNCLAGTKSVMDLDPQQVAALDPKFIEALKKAQMLEANHLVEINPVRDKIRMGIISETIGESSMFFKQKGAEERSIYPGISDDAYPVLSKYLYRETSNAQIWKLRRS